MFLKHYGFREQPFGVTPNPRFLYQSPTHREALASLVYAIENDLGFTALVAEPGMGKTTLLFHVLEKLRDTARTAFVFQTQCTPQELLQYVLSELEILVPQENAVALHEHFRDALLLESRAGRRVVIVIDEAHNLSPSALETVRLLSNFETPESKLLHIILSGQPKLARMLASEELSQLLQRIAIFCELKPLNSEETRAYIDHRMQTAGYHGDPIFTSDALAQIAKFSGGVPREINRICFNALSLGCALQKPRISAELVDEVGDDLHITALLRAKASSSQPAPIDFTPVTPQAAKPAVAAPAVRPAAAKPHSVVANPVVRSPLAVTPANSTFPATASYAKDRRPEVQSGGPGVANPAPTVPATVAPPKPVVTAIMTPKTSVKTPQRQVHARRSVPAPVLGMLLLCVIVVGGWAGAARLQQWLGTKEHDVRSEQQLPQTAGAQEQTSGDSAPSDKTGGVERGANPQPAAPATRTEANSAAQTRHQVSARSSNSRQSGPRASRYARGRKESRLRTRNLSEEVSGGGGVSAAREVEAPVDRTRSLSAVASPQRQPQPVGVAEPVPAAATQVPAASDYFESAYPISKVTPIYPAYARENSIQGSVILNAHIGKDGRVTDVKSMGGNPYLAQAAADAVRQWVYKPYKLNGRPVETDNVVVIQFLLPEKE
ncbi:MAG: TonB family protein [Terriglobales bacterium]